MALAFLDLSTLVDVFSWLDRRTLANGVESTCRYFKSVIEQVVTHLARQPHHLIENVSFSTWYRKMGEIERELRWKLSSCLWRGRKEEMKKQIQIHIYQYLWLKMGSSTTIAGKNASQLSRNDVENWIRKRRRKKLGNGNRLPWTLPPCFVRFKLTFVSVDLFAASDNCFWPPPMLIAILEQMIPNLQGTNLHIRDSKNWVWERREERWKRERWESKNDIHDLTQVFGHPTLRKLIGAGDWCSCDLITLVPQQKSLMIKRGMEQHYEGLLLSGLLDCDCFIYRGGGILGLEDPMFSVREVAKWLNHPLAHPQRSKAERRLLIEIRTNEAIVGQKWFEELEQKLVEEFHSAESSSNIFDDNYSNVSPSSCPPFTLFVKTGHFHEAQPCVRTLAKNAKGEDLQLAINALPEDVSIRGWISSSIDEFGSNFFIIRLDDEHPIHDNMYYHFSLHSCVIFSH